MKKKIINILLDFSDDTIDLSRRDKQVIAGVLAKKIIDLINPIKKIEKLEQESIEDVKTALNNNDYSKPKNDYTDEEAIIDVINLEVGDWADYFNGYYCALAELKSDLTIK